MTTSQGTTKKSSSDSVNLYEQATSEIATDVDKTLLNMKRVDVLDLPAHARLRWFYLMQCRHKELSRVTSDLLELLEPTPLHRSSRAT